MTFRPLSDRVLIKRDAPITKIGSLLIPEGAQRKSETGTVIAVGPGVQTNGDLVPLTLVAGDRVSFPAWMGTQIKVDGEDHWVMHENEINGLVDD